MFCDQYHPCVGTAVRGQYRDVLFPYQGCIRMGGTCVLLVGQSLEYRQQEIQILPRGSSFLYPGLLYIHFCRLFFYRFACFEFMRRSEANAAKQKEKAREFLLFLLLL